MAHLLLREGNKLQPFKAQVGVVLLQKSCRHLESRELPHSGSTWHLDGNLLLALAQRATPGQGHSKA